jgi:hypothetical protein
MARELTKLAKLFPGDLVSDQIAAVAARVRDIAKLIERDDAQNRWPSGGSKVEAGYGIRKD